MYVLFVVIFLHAPCSSSAHWTHHHGYYYIRGAHNARAIREKYHIVRPTMYKLDVPHVYVWYMWYALFIRWQHKCMLLFNTPHYTDTDTKPTHARSTHYSTSSPFVLTNSLIYKHYTRTWHLICQRIGGAYTHTFCFGRILVRAGRRRWTTTSAAAWSATAPTGIFPFPHLRDDYMDRANDASFHTSVFIICATAHTRLDL